MIEELEKLSQLALMQASDSTPYLAWEGMLDSVLKKTLHMIAST